MSDDVKAAAERWAKNDYYSLTGNDHWKAEGMARRDAGTLSDAYLAERCWRPIETAPKDGREVLIRVTQRAGIPGKCLVGHWQRGGHCIEDHPEIDAGWYFWNGQMFDAASKPTHWMPLPDAAV